MSKVTLAEKVRKVLVDQIIGGQLMPGTRLDEVEQARLFAVSRTPVREAFRQLTAIGLVENRPHRGVVVTPVTPELVRDLHQAYAAIGEACLRLACQGTARPFAGLTASGGDDAIAFAVHEASGNSVLKDIGAALWIRLKPYRSGRPGLGGVAAALIAGDEQAAIAELRRVMLSTEQD